MLERLPGFLVNRAAFLDRLVAYVHKGGPKRDAQAALADVFWALLNSTEFFLNHARLTLFDKLIAASVRVSHLSFDMTVFIWYAASIFLTLLACWEWNNEFFSEPEGRWAGVAMFAGLLTLPVAGTSLYILDQYLTPRAIVLFALLFAISTLEDSLTVGGRKYWDGITTESGADAPASQCTAHL